MSEEKQASMDWEAGVSLDARETMRIIGHFMPTLSAENEEVKGVLYGDRAYLSAKELREMARHFVEVADWLECRRLSQPHTRASDSKEGGE